MSPNPLSNRLFRILSAYALLLCAIMVLDMQASRAEPGFNFNWQRVGDADGKRAEMTCNLPGSSNTGSCSGSLADDRFFSFANTAQSGTGTDTTPFLQEFVEVGGVKYYHVIVGDGLAAQGFAQEAYIRVGSSNRVFADGHESSSSGGRGFKDSSDWRSCADGAAVSDACANGWDPLRNNAAAFTGNGSANPERVIMRQVLKDGGLVDTFEKTSFALKPKLTQTLTTPELSAVFSLDMGNSDYKASTTADNTTRGVMTNTLTLIDPRTPTNAGNFGVVGATAQTHKSVVTGGLFIWAPGLDADFGFSNGTYTYGEGGRFDVNAVNWKEFKN